jgi:hypothetical protein
MSFSYKLPVYNLDILKMYGGSLFSRVENKECSQIGKHADQEEEMNLVGKAIGNYVRFTLPANF